MKVAAHVAYGNVKLKCPACSAPGAEALRDMDGCDVSQRFGTPTSDAKGKLFPEYEGHFPRISITCTVCAGRDHGCKVCRGSGEEPVFQCPGSVCDGYTSEVMRAYQDYKNGIMPDEGGMYSQAAPFVDLVRVVEAEFAALQAEEQRIAKSKSKKSR